MVVPLMETWIIVLLTFMSVIIIPGQVIIVRGAVKWTKTEDKLAGLMVSMEKLVEEKEKVHAAIIEQMTADREATDRRFRFIEEYWMSAGQMRQRRRMLMPPALRGIIRDALRRWWPTLRIHAETNDRESPLIIDWRGRTYRIWCEEKL